MDQIPQNIRKKKEKGQLPTEKKPIRFVYRLVIAPSLTSESVRGDLFKFYDMPFVRAEHHLNEKGQPLAIKWCGNKAVIIHFANNDLYMYSVSDGDSVKIEKDRPEKERWIFLSEEMDGTRVISKR